MKSQPNRVLDMSSALSFFLKTCVIESDSLMETKVNISHRELSLCVFFFILKTLRAHEALAGFCIVVMD